MYVRVPIQTRVITPTLTYYNRLKELLRLRLKECGWRDKLKEHCRGKQVCLLSDITIFLSVSMLTAKVDIISEKGLNNITVDSLVEEITPRARGTITALGF